MNDWLTESLPDCNHAFMQQCKIAGKTQSKHAIIQACMNENGLTLHTQ
jgi:hypothetical protein